MMQSYTVFRHGNSVRVYAVALLAISLAACGQAFAGTIYVLGSPSGNGNNLTTNFGSIDTATGRYTLISGTINGTGAGATVSNLAWSGSGTTFYTFASTGGNTTLRTLTTTGTTVSASIGTTGVTIGGAAFDTSSSILYAYDKTNEDWVSINTGNGAKTIINNNPGAGFGTPIGGRLAYHSGTMFLVSPRGSPNPQESAFGRMSNPITSNTTSYISIATGTSFRDMVIASDGTNLYGLVAVTTGTALLYSIDTANGALTKVSDVTPVSGSTLPLQFNGAACAIVVPEPSTIALAVSGIAFIAAGMRRIGRPMTIREASAERGGS
jgi:hypothetical protein